MFYEIICENPNSITNWKVYLYGVVEDDKMDDRVIDLICRYNLHPVELNKINVFTYVYRKYIKLPNKFGFGYRLIAR